MSDFLRSLPRLVPDNVDIYDESLWLRVQGKIYTRPHSEAIQHAQPFSNKRNFDGILALFTDGSGSNRFNDQGHQWTSAAVVWRAKSDDEEWTKLGFSLPRNFKSSRAEIWAIYKALHVAYEYVITSTNWHFDTVKVFTDFESILKQLKPLKEKDGRRLRWEDQLVNELLWLDGALAACGVDVEYHWIPRASVEGNVVADHVAHMHRPDVDDPITYPPPPARPFARRDRQREEHNQMLVRRSEREEDEYYEDQDNQNKLALYNPDTPLPALVPP